MAAAASGDAEESEATTDEDLDSNGGASKPVVRAVPRKVGLGSSGAGMASKHGSRKSFAAAKKKPEPERSRSPHSRAATEANPFGTDREMQRISEKLGGNNACLTALVVKRHLAGEKLGVRVVAARCCEKQTVTFIALLHSA